VTVNGNTVDTVRELLASARLDLPHPGCGATADRHRALSGIARTMPVGVARLAEAHCDAMSILHEAGTAPVGGALYGVWASAGTASLSGDRASLSGTSPFCSGLGIVDRALVSVSDATGRPLLIDIDLEMRSSITFDTSGWSTVALADTATGAVRFDDDPLDADRIVGCPGWYLDRVGFWHGACGPAACWAGGTLGVIDVAHRLGASDPHRRAQLGALEAASWTLDALLAAAGNEIDASPDDRVAAPRRARSLRHAVERTCSDVLDRFSRAFGPRPFASDAALATRFADVHLYLRQHHGERELGAIVDGVECTNPDSETR
jgi:hypothetical protein